MFASGNQYSDDALMRADFLRSDGWSCHDTWYYTIGVVLERRDWGVGLHKVIARDAPLHP